MKTSEWIQEKNKFQADVQDFKDNNDQQIAGYVLLDSFAALLPMWQHTMEIQL